MLKNKRLRRTFFKSTLITMFSFLLLSGALVLAWRGFVQPPTIPAMAVNPSNPNLDYDRPASYDVEPHPGDANVGLNPPIHFTDADRRDDFFTFLIFGYDDGLNTDTIMVAAFDAAARRAYIVSIPRDTQVDVQRSVRKINSAYPAGRRHGGGHAGGVDQLKREVQTIIGFRPDFYISIDENVFVVLVDAVGGVYIDVPFRMHYRDPVQDLFMDIPAGLQRLDGENALNFVRFRYHYGRRSAISVHQRMEHQHQFVNAMMHELRSPMTVIRIPQLIRAYREHINTDLNLHNLLWFGEQFVLGEIELITYNYPVTSVRQNLWYDIPNAAEALEIINRTINPFTRDITIDMLRLAS